MNAINRQKFLAELSKLLTFMYEEDRQRALSMYERMFDITEDEQGLLDAYDTPVDFRDKENIRPLIEFVLK